MARQHVTTIINGDQVEVLCEVDQSLLDVLRDELQYTGTKEGCGTGDCGACSVMLDGRLVCSCLVLGVEADGKTVDTIEGMADGDDLHPLQAKFIERAALQCGICTPGILVAARARCVSMSRKTSRGGGGSSAGPVASIGASDRSGAASCAVDAGNGSRPSSSCSARTAPALSIGRFPLPHFFLL